MIRSLIIAATLAITITTAGAAFAKSAPAKAAASAPAKAVAALAQATKAPTSTPTERYVRITPARKVPLQVTFTPDPKLASEADGGVIARFGDLNVRFGKGQPDSVTVGFSFSF